MISYLNVSAFNPERKVVYFLTGFTIWSQHLNHKIQVPRVIGIGIIYNAIYENHLLKSS